MFGNLTGNISLNARTLVNPAVSTTCLIVDASVWYKEWYRFPSDAVRASSRLLTFAFESALATRYFLSSRFIIASGSSGFPALSQKQSLASRLMAWNSLGERVQYQTLDQACHSLRSQRRRIPLVIGER